MKLLIEKIRNIANNIKRTVKIMEVCGGHTHTIMKFNLRSILPENIKMISGPGCPVCVTSQRDIDSVIELALNNVKIATYGDLLRVPGSKTCLDDARSQGAKVKMIYSVTELLKDKKNLNDCVFFGIGFETTTPMSAFLLKKEFVIYSAHKVLVPAMDVIVNSDMKIDGFINPGHVSTIIGAKAYEELKVPQVISGFGVAEILRSVYLLLKLIKNNENKVVNGYSEVVKPEGNIKAKNLINETMKTTDHEWRGIGTIPNSGYDPIDDNLNAKIIYKDILKNIKTSESSTACRCGEVIKGLIEPKECSLFGKACNPENPKGACMVSEEGACRICYKYKNNIG